MNRKLDESSPERTSHQQQSLADRSNKQLASTSTTDSEATTREHTIGNKRPRLADEESVVLQEATNGTPPDRLIDHGRSVQLPSDQSCKPNLRPETPQESSAIDHHLVSKAFHANHSEADRGSNLALLMSSSFTIDPYRHLTPHWDQPHRMDTLPSPFRPTGTTNAYVSNNLERQHITAGSDDVLPPLRASHSCSATDIHQHHQSLPQQNQQLHPIDSQTTASTTTATSHQEVQSMLQHPSFSAMVPGLHGRQVLSMPTPALNATAAHLMVMAASAGLSVGLSVGPQQATALFMAQTTVPYLAGAVNLQNQPQAAPHNAVTSSLADTYKRGPMLYIPTDDDVLSENQVMLRKQIEFFEAPLDEVGKTTSGRRRPIMLNQVGIQCRHCASSLPARYRQKGAVYYPAKLTGIYQASQNMAVTHLANLCQHIDDQTKKQLQVYQQARSATGHGGKQYWADTAKAQGIVEAAEGGLRFATTSLHLNSSSGHMMNTSMNTTMPPPT